MPAPRPPMTRNLARRDYQNGVPVKEIMCRYGIGRKTFYEWMKNKFDIPYRQSKANPMTYTDERLIQILTTVNATAIDNDGGKPGKHLAEVCRQAASRLQQLTTHRDDPTYLNRPARCHEYFGDDENVGC
jgi:transposase